jgi:hypothetical protein
LHIFERRINMRKRLIPVVLALSLALTACGKEAEGALDTTEVVEATTPEPTPEITPEPTEEPEPEPAKFEFNPHVYSPILAERFGPEYWESFYNLCDALRAGEDTFECASQEVYDWCTEEVILCALFPAACCKVCGVSDDGTVPFENGVGRIYYKMPKEEFLQREKDFEDMITEILNDNVRTDYSDFEKTLAIHDYFAREYTYDEDIFDHEDDGASYSTFVYKNGVCSELAIAYAYLLMQCGVDAISAGSFDIFHSFDYIRLNGKGYFIDPTWSLWSEYNTDHTPLHYFLITEKDREIDGCTIENNKVELLRYFNAVLKIDDYVVSATDDTYAAFRRTHFLGMDTEKNIVKLLDLETGKTREFHYED